jgi:hypothetical protein
MQTAIAERNNLVELLTEIGQGDPMLGYQMMQNGTIQEALNLLDPDGPVFIKSQRLREALVSEISSLIDEWSENG